MIQELLGSGLVEDSKIAIAGGLLGPATDGPSSCFSPSFATSSATSSAAASPTTSTAANSEQQNLRCPRCDSTNTKFCYYNNYNLTQPRHFCKTCRRYWTKGGALRNVPIGGGCRKAKATGISVIGSGKSGTGSGSKAKFLASDLVVGKSSFSGLGIGSSGDAAGFDHELPSSPILWPAPQNSHLLALLTATQRSGINNTNRGSATAIPNPNPSPSPGINPNPVRIKEEGPIHGSHLVPEASLLRNALNARNMGVDPLPQFPLGLSSSMWNSLHQYQHQQQPPEQQQTQQHSGFVIGELPSSGIPELIYRKLRPSGNCYVDHQAVLLSNVGNSPSLSSSISLSHTTTTTAAAATAATATSITSNILEPAAVVGGEFGYWSSPFSWADMSSNGAFP